MNEKKFVLEVAWSLAKFRSTINVQKKRFYNKLKNSSMDFSGLRTSKSKIHLHVNLRLYVQYTWISFDLGLVQKSILFDYLKFTRT